MPQRWAGWCESQLASLGQRGAGLSGMSLHSRAWPLCQKAQKYEKSLKELGQSTPQYMESMEQVSEQCQQSGGRSYLRFFREALLRCRSTWICRTWPGECPSPGSSGLLLSRLWGGVGVVLRSLPGWPQGVLPSRMAACWPKSDGLLPRPASPGAELCVWAGSGRAAAWIGYSDTFEINLGQVQ